MKLSRRNFAIGSAAMLAATRVGTASGQAAWPPANGRVIVPFSAGGSVDAMGRIAAEGLNKRNKSANFVVENRTGASGAVGAGVVAKAPADGSHWLMTFDIHAVLPSLMQSLPYDNDKELIPVTVIGTSPMVFVTGANSPFSTFEQMVAYAKSKGNLNYGSGSSGTFGHLMITTVAQRTGTQMTHVNYRGGAPALNDTIAGHIDGFIGSSAIVASHIAAGKVKPILQTGATRGAAVPNTPTTKEIGYADLVADDWWGFFGTGGTPRTVVDACYADIKAAFEEPEIKKRLTESFHVKTLLSPPNEFKAFFESEMKRWGKIVKDNNIRAG